MGNAPWLDNPAGYQGLPLRTPTIPPAEHTNCYVIGHKDALIVDPGSAYPKELDLLRDMLWRLRGSGGSIGAVFLTHHHVDHVGGAAQIAAEFDAPIAAHAETLSRVKTSYEGEALELRGVDEGEIFEIDGDRELLALFTPGHAPGHLCLFEQKEKILVAGDMIPGVGTIVIDPDEGDMAIYLEHLSRLAALDPQKTLPAHGPILDDGRQGIEALISHRLGREAKIFDALSGAFADLMEITTAAYDDVPTMLLPLASRSALAHLIKLEKDDRAERESEKWRILQR